MPQRVLTYDISDLLDIILHSGQLGLLIWLLLIISYVTCWGMLLLGGPARRAILIYSLCRLMMILLIMFSFTGIIDSFSGGPIARYFQIFSFDDIFFALFFGVICILILLIFTRMRFGVFPRLNVVSSLGVYFYVIDLGITLVLIIKILHLS